MKYLAPLILAWSFLAFVSECCSSLPKDDEILPTTISTHPSSEGKTSISFMGGSYFSGSYQAGIIDYLLKNFDLSETRFVGDSSGAMCVVGAALEFEGEQILDFTIKCIKEKEKLPFKGVSSWGQIIERNLKALIREKYPTGNIRKLVKNRLSFSVTHVLFFKIPYFNIEIPYGWKGELISDFKTVDEVLEGMLVSCQIPGLPNPNVFAKFRGNTYLDGGFANSNPKLDKNTCLINPFLWRDMDFWAIHGNFTLPTEEQARQAFKWGYEDAEENCRYFVNHGFKMKSSLPTVIEESGFSLSTAIKEPAIHYPYPLAKLYRFSQGAKAMYS